jgi:HEAT repeat protein
MTLLRVLAVTQPGKQTWFWATADIVVGVLLFLNVLLLVFVHARRVRLASRGQRAERFRGRLEELFAEQDLTAVAKQVRSFNELERPIAAEFVIERLRTASPEEREQTLAWLRQIGAIDVLLRSVSRWQPWRRALAIRTLGLAGASEGVPLLIERLSDRSRYVREATVRALGRIGDQRALPVLAHLFGEPGQAGAGIVYEALLAFGNDAAPVFHEGLRSPNEHVRVASVFGLGSVLEPRAAAAQVEHMLGGESPLVRASAAQVLERVGNGSVPAGLVRAAHDEQRSVRRAAVSAFASYDDSQALLLALGALDDPDRDVAIRAGETLVRLAACRASGPKRDVPSRRRTPGRSSGLACSRPWGRSRDAHRDRGRDARDLLLLAHLRPDDAEPDRAVALRGVAAEGRTW